MEADKTGRPRLPGIVLAPALTIFFSCFGFPIYNFGKERPLPATAAHIALELSCAAAAGGILAKTFPKRHRVFVLLLPAALTAAGLVCRFFLEFGEVSNTYDFTLLNVLFHVMVFAGLCSLSWLCAAQGEINRNFS